MRILLLVLVVVTIVVVSIAVVTLMSQEVGNDFSVKEVSLLNHPIYSRYKFENQENVIAIGTQPAYLPTGLITEAMKRDILLKKALSELGIRLTFYSFLKGSDINFFLKRGQIDAVVAGGISAIIAAVTFDVTVTNILQQGFTSIVAGEYMLMSQLRGKRIAYAFGSNAHYALLQGLSSVGLNEEDVHLIPMDINRMSDALAERKIDVFSAWEPIPTIALKRYEKAVIIRRNLNSGYLYFSNNFLAKHRQAIFQIVASSIRAVRWMRASEENLLKASAWSEEAAKRLLGKESGLSLKEIAELAKKDFIGMRQPSCIPQRDLEQRGLLYREFDFLKDLGEISATAKWSKIQRSFNRAVIKEIPFNPRKFRLNEYNYTVKGDSGEE